MTQKEFYGEMLNQDKDLFCSICLELFIKVMTLVISIIIIKIPYNMINNNRFIVIILT